MSTATLSSKGQIVIPSAVRERLGWTPGTVLEVESRGDTVVLRPARPFAESQVDELLGILSFDGPAKTLEQMNEGIAQGARRSGKGEP